MCRYSEQEGLVAEGEFGPFDAVMIAEDAELPAHSKVLAAECGALKQSICFSPSKHVINATVKCVLSGLLLVVCSSMHTTSISPEGSRLFTVLK